MKKRLLRLIALLFIFLSFNSCVFAQYYSDISDKHWANIYVKMLTEGSIVYGYPEGTFKPDQNITRAEFSSMLVRTINQVNAPISDKQTFLDVPKTHWAYPYIERAAFFDLLSDTKNKNFRPNDTVVRGEVIDVVINALNTKPMNAKEARELLAQSYTDVSKVPDSMIIPIGKAQLLGMVVTPPNSPKLIDAKKPATRAEVVAFLFKLKENINISPNRKLVKVLPKKAKGYYVDRVIVVDNIAYVPRGVELPVLIEKPLFSQKTKKGESFIGTVADNIVTRKESYLLISKGSKVAGVVNQSKSAIPLIRNGKIVINTSAIRTLSDEQLANLQTISTLQNTYTGFKKEFKNSILKYGKVEYKAGDVIYLRITQPVRIDLINGNIMPFEEEAATPAEDGANLEPAATPIVPQTKVESSQVKGNVQEQTK